MKYKAYNAKKIYNVRLSKNNLKKGLMPPHPAIFIKREQFFKNGFFNKKYRSAADFDLLCNYLLKDTDHITIDKEIAILEEISSWMDINKESIFNTRPWKVFET